MGNKELYWIGPGVYSVGSKVQDISKPISENKVGKTFIERNVKLGNIGEKVGTTEIISVDAATEIDRLKKQNEKLLSNVKSLKESVKKLTEKVKSFEDKK